MGYTESCGDFVEVEVYSGRWKQPDDGRFTTPHNIHLTMALPVLLITQHPHDAT